MRSSSHFPAIFNEEFVDLFGNLFSDIQSNRIFNFKNQYSSFEHSDKGLTIQYATHDSSGKRDNKKIFIPHELLNSNTLQDDINHLAEVEIKKLAEVSVSKKQDEIKMLEERLSKLKSSKE